MLKPLKVRLVKRSGSWLMKVIANSKPSMELFISIRRNFVCDGFWMFLFSSFNEVMAKRININERR